MEIEPRWNSCVIAASGPSLTPEVAAACAGQNIIAVSNAYELFPNADIIYSGDSRWFEVHKGIKDLPGELWSFYDPDRPAEKDKAKVAENLGINLVDVHYDEEFSLDPSYINSGNNSGFAGLNLAILMGAKRIVLVGYNMRYGEDGKRHFFGDHPAPLKNPPEKVFDGWVETFTKAAKNLPADIQIVNATDNSSLDCFPKWSLEAALAWALPDTVKAKRAVEHAKYERAYEREAYRMARRQPAAVSDLSAVPVGQSYLDVSCGRGEMLGEAEKLGYSQVKGTEIVKDLIDGDRVIYGEVHDLPFKSKSFDTVTMFDVIEHLLPGDDELACRELARVARKTILISAANNVSIKPNGDVLHVNIRPYTEWDQLFRKWFPGKVTWISDDQLRPSQTWRIDMDVAAVRQENRGPMRFRYIGEVDAKGEAVVFGVTVRHGEDYDFSGLRAEKARKNRYFKESPQDSVLSRSELVALAEGKNIKVEKGWTAEQIASAIENPNGSDGSDYDPFKGMSRDDLVAMAEERGVKIDKRWGDEKIAKAIQSQV